MINLAVFVLELLSPEIIDLLALTPTVAVGSGMYWQFFTFMFVHAGLNHIFLNMFGLMIFGPRIEMEMGKRKFLIYYLICGISSGLLHIIVTGISDSVLLGASGAVFGVLTAYGIMFPRHIIYVNFFFPMPAILVVIFFAIIEFVSGVFDPFSDIAHFGHLGGMLAGFILLFAFGFRKRRRFRFFWE